MDIKKEREAFQHEFQKTEQYRQQYGFYKIPLKYDEQNETWNFYDVQAAWQMWQAAQAVPEWISTTDQLPVIKKCSEKLFNVVMLDYKSGSFVTSLTYMHEYEFYDSEDNFESERNEDGYVYHTGWVNHLNDDFFESIEADKVLYWMELPRVIEAQERSYEHS